MGWLYQLAIYAVASAERTAVILYPIEDPAAANNACGSSCSRCYNLANFLGPLALPDEVAQRAENCRTLPKRGAKRRDAVG